MPSTPNRKKQAGYPVGFVLQIHNGLPDRLASGGTGPCACNQGTLPEAAQFNTDLIIRRTPALAFFRKAT